MTPCHLVQKTGRVRVLPSVRRDKPSKFILEGFFMCYTYILYSATLDCYYKGFRDQGQNLGIRPKKGKSVEEKGYVFYAA